ncbi:MAG: DUF3575 domain-containing protein [Clostridiales bacterium]|nr:DUF3575 domain-containing protein [Clostridiales bacterium]
MKFRQAHIVSILLLLWFCISCSTEQEPDFIADFSIDGGTASSVADSLGIAAGSLDSLLAAHPELGRLVTANYDLDSLGAANPGIDSLLRDHPEIVARVESREAGESLPGWGISGEGLQGAADSLAAGGGLQGAADSLETLSQAGGAETVSPADSLSGGRIEGAAVTGVIEGVAGSLESESTESPADTLRSPADTLAASSDTAATVEWTRRLNFLSNAVYWCAAVSNVAVEIDLCDHLSFYFPVNYSAWNYFKSDIKFRVLAFQPEFRYWFSTKSGYNAGWFVGAHFGLAEYDIATHGEYRIQDHDGKRPGLGGGIAGGYRLPLTKNRRWNVEFSLGVGVYSLYDDIFHNYSEGLMTSSGKKTYIGPDQLNVSFSYSIDLKKKGGAK